MYVPHENFAPFADAGWPCDNDADRATFTRDVFSEMRASFDFGRCIKFRNMMNENGMFVGDHGVTFDPMKLGNIYAVCERIMDEYDDSNDENPTWDEYGLSGDDDVDYFGSHPISGIDAIRAYCDAHNISHT